MNFIETIVSQLSKNPDRGFVGEVSPSGIRFSSGAQLLSMAARYQAVFAEQKIVSGERVAFVAPNSAAWVAFDLACLATGIVSVPLYVRQSPQELFKILQNADVRAVWFADSSLLDSVKAQGFERPLLLLDASANHGENKKLEVLARGSEVIATIVYTSGTSGEPKGVLNAIGSVDFMMGVLAAKLLELTQKKPGNDRVFHYLPFCFSGSRMVLWACLHRGNGIMVSTNLENLQAELALAQPNYFLNVPALLDRVRAGVGKKMAERPKLIQSIYRRGSAAKMALIADPSTLIGLRDRAAMVLFEKLVAPKIRGQISPNLIGLICGSAPLSEATQRWYQAVGIPVYQVYGLTETTAIVTMDSRDESAAGYVGKAINGCEIKLGEENELCARGPNIFAGYFRNEEATQQVLDQDGWFHTGDQAELDGEGRLRVIGRVKNLLVPSSGHNISPEPLEELLLDVPGVAQAVVFGHARPHLVALLVGNVDEGAARAGIDRLNATLPHYKRIRAFYRSAEPLTPESGLLTANQKLKRRAIESHFKQQIDALYASDR